MWKFFIRIITYTEQRYSMMLWSAWLVLFLELVNRGDVMEPFSWAGFHFNSFALNISLVISLVFLATAATGHARVGFWIVSLLSFILALISGIKLKALGVPLLPWDFVLAGEGKDMAGYLKNIADSRLIGGIVVFVLVSCALLYLSPQSPKKIAWRERIGMALASIALILLLFAGKAVSPVNLFRVHPTPSDQAVNVRTNGFLLTMLLNIHEMYHQKPPGYNNNAIAAFATMPVSQPDSDGVKPNMIVILSESFFDPTIIPTLTFSRDPLPFFHTLQQSYTNGTMLTPQFGGGTANVEFEVLTGNSMHFLPQGSIAYNQYINRPIDSLASILARQGYTSTAISPFHNWFFNSNNVYKYFGFGKYISLEFFDPNYEGPYIADNEVAKNIIKTTEISNGPDFVFANTMENHFHYWPGKFKENTIRVDGVTGNSKGFIETYAQGLVDADKMLHTLVDYYQASNEPTIILWFGDHLPYLGDNYQFYKDAKYITGEDDPTFLEKIHRTPVLVWNNYLPKNQKGTINMNPSFLSPYLLDLAKQKGTYYTDFLRNLSKRVPLIPPKQDYAKYGVTQDDLSQYEDLQYDILFGEQQGYAGWKGQIVNPDYHLGYQAISISNVSPDSVTEGDSDIMLTITGAYLPAQSVVTWDGKPLETSYGGDESGSLTAKVPAQLLKAGTAEIQARLTDSQDHVVGESNQVEVTIQKK